MKDSNMTQSRKQDLRLKKGDSYFLVALSMIESLCYAE